MSGIINKAGTSSGSIGITQRLVTAAGESGGGGGGGAGGSMQAVASGTLADGDKVVLLSDGTVQKAGQPTGPDAFLDTPIDDDNETSSTTSRNTTIISWDPNDNNKFAIFYYDNGGDGRPTLVIGTLSGTTLSFGSQIEVDAGATQGGQSGHGWVAFHPTIANLIMCAWSPMDPTALACRAGSVSGTTVSWGTTITLDWDEFGNIMYDGAGIASGGGLKICFDWFRDTDVARRFMLAIVMFDGMMEEEVLVMAGSCSSDSGGTITMNGSDAAQIMQAPNPSMMGPAGVFVRCAPDEGPGTERHGCALVTYGDPGSPETGVALVRAVNLVTTVHNTTGIPNSSGATGTTYFEWSGHVTGSYTELDHFVISYVDDNSDHNFRTGVVSWNHVSNPGYTITLQNPFTAFATGQSTIRYPGKPTFITKGSFASTDKFFVHYYDHNSAPAGKKMLIRSYDVDDWAAGTISTTTGTEVEIAGYHDPSFTAGDSNYENRLALVTSDGNSGGTDHNITTVKLVGAAVGPTNVTSTSFLGISDGAYGDGATATIQILGAVDDAQSGLTTGYKYYVQQDGSMTTTRGTGTLVGTAISATKLLIAQASGGAQPTLQTTFTAPCKTDAIAVGDRCIIVNDGGVAKVKKVSGGLQSLIFRPPADTLGNGFFSDWQYGNNGYFFHDMCSQLWNYAQTLSPNPFASENALKAAAYTSFTNPALGMYFHENIGNPGWQDYTQVAITTSGVWGDYYLPVLSYTPINSSRGSGWANYQIYSSHINVITYKQMVFGFTYDAQVSNISETNLLGYATNAAVDGENCTVDLIGSTVWNQSAGGAPLVIGTAYYIQTDGTLGTTSTSHYAGVALSTSSVLVNQSY